MCEPATLTMLYLAATAVGTGVTMYGKDTAANQEEANAKFAADQAEADARAEQGAAQVEAERIRREGKRPRSTAVAAAAAAGVDVDSPTAPKTAQEITANDRAGDFTEVANGGDPPRRLHQPGPADTHATSNPTSR